MNSGAQAELAASRYLQKHGLQLIAQNYRCRFGEIDLIMQDGETLVFAEVRLRNNKNFGGAASSIDTRKQRKLICTAQHYLSLIGHTPACRFDAVLLISPQIAKSGGQYPLYEFQDADIVWIKNAFDA